MSRQNMLVEFKLHRIVIIILNYISASWRQGTPTGLSELDGPRWQALSPLWHKPFGTVWLVNTCLSLRRKTGGPLLPSSCRGGISPTVLAPLLGNMQSPSLHRPWVRNSTTRVDIQLYSWLLLTPASVSLLSNLVLMAREVMAGSSGTLPSGQALFSKKFIFI